MNLRKKINNDLERSVEKPSDWGLPVSLIGPDGKVYSTKKDTTDQLYGQILYSRVSFNPDTGEELIIDDPVVTLRLASLERVPQPGEKWVFKIPEIPDPEAALASFMFTPTKTPQFNRSLGFAIYYLQQAEQS